MYTVVYYALTAFNSTNDIMNNCINGDLNMISNWLQSNRLSLNTDKSGFMLIRSKQQLKSVKDDIYNVLIFNNWHLYSALRRTQRLT